MMTETPKLKGPNCLNIYKELVVRHNEPVIAGHDIARLIGYAEDDCDCYLILHSKRHGVVWHTAVGGYTFLTMLKGQHVVRSNEGETWDDLFRLSEHLRMNGVPLADEFQVILHEDGGK